MRKCKTARRARRTVKKNLPRIIEMRRLNALRKIYNSMRRHFAAFDQEQANPY